MTTAHPASARPAVRVPTLHTAHDLPPATAYSLPSLHKPLSVREATRGADACDDAAALYTDFPLSHHTADTHATPTLMQYYFDTDPTAVTATTAAPAERLLGSADFVECLVREMRQSCHPPDLDAEAGSPTEHDVVPLSSHRAPPTRPHHSSSASVSNNGGMWDVPRRGTSPSPVPRRDVALSLSAHSSVRAASATSSPTRPSSLLRRTHTTPTLPDETSRRPVRAPRWTRAPIPSRPGWNVHRPTPRNRPRLSAEDVAPPPSTRPPVPPTRAALTTRELFPTDAVNGNRATPVAVWQSRVEELERAVETATRRAGAAEARCAEMQTAVDQLTASWEQDRAAWAQQHRALTGQLECVLHLVQGLDRRLGSPVQGGVVRAELERIYGEGVWGRGVTTMADPVQTVPHVWGKDAAVSPCETATPHGVTPSPATSRRSGSTLRIPPSPPMTLQLHTA